MLTVQVALSGGLEAWTHDQAREQSVALTTERTVGALIAAFAAQCLAETGRKHFLGPDEKLKSGIIVLVNEVDWEFLAESAEARESLRLEEGDRVRFITTLHGG